MNGHGHGANYKWASTSSAPVTPEPNTSLAGVEEENFGEDTPIAGISTSTSEYFGAEVMDLRRDRRRSGIENLLTTTPQRRGLGLMGSPSFASSSRLTALPTARHPLSLSALHHSLHGALAAKRHSCSHLLALRFEQDEPGSDDSDYWDDVQSVMALLTSTLADASARLVEALDEVERQRMEDEVPSDTGHSRRVSLASNSAEGHGPVESISLAPDDADVTVGRRKGRTMQQMVGFAPMPSHIVRFAAHVDAIFSAMDNAKEHLEETVAALRGEESSITPDSGSDSGSINRPQDSPALMAYERLRRELGFALRECERGRERLLDIIAASQPQAEADESDGEDVPALAPDMDSEGSSKEFPSLDTHSASPHAVERVLLEDSSGTNPTVVHSEDDASQHLRLVSSAQHLPPPGIEQVFEGESAATVFTRERSKLSREERIRLAKQRREQGTASGSVSSLEGVGEIRGVERWGPGGDVVQELKDVIWKVGERRRKIARQASVDQTTIAIEPPSGSPSPAVDWHGSVRASV
jgi:predicted RNase H-like HicB family nuclease